MVTKFPDVFTRSWMSIEGKENVQSATKSLRFLAESQQQ